MKVLFIGNSHTYFNDMPELFAKAVEATVGEKPEVVMLAYSGRELAWHREEYYAVRFNLTYGGYDYCVFQQAAHPYPPEETTLEMNAEFARLCRLNGTKPVIFMTWAEKAHPENQAKMIEVCERSARETGALLAPIGRVWEKICQNEMDIELYHTDGAHAGPYGDFLIAAALCKLTVGGVADSFCGVGHSFIDGRSDMDARFPTVIEDRAAVPCELDPDKCRRILAAVREA